MKEVLARGAARLREEVRSDDVLVFYMRDLSGAASPAAPAELVVRPATGEDASLYARDIGTDSAKTFRGRLTDATRCWLVLEDDRILHASWTTTRAAWTRELRRYFRPPPGALYVYESFTRADARGRGVYPLALGSMCAAAAREGLERAWVGVEAHNEASIRAIEKGGFRPGFEVPFGRRGGRLYLRALPGDNEGICAGCLSLSP